MPDHDAIDVVCEATLAGVMRWRPQRTRGGGAASLVGALGRQQWRLERETGGRITFLRLSYAPAICAGVPEWLMASRGLARHDGEGRVESPDFSRLERLFTAALNAREVVGMGVG